MKDSNSGPHDPKAGALTTQPSGHFIKEQSDLCLHYHYSNQPSPHSGQVWLTVKENGYNSKSNNSDMEKLASLLVGATLKGKNLLPFGSKLFLL